jgi:8-amino-7-oxononanoate synthase
VSDDGAARRGPLRHLAESLAQLEGIDRLRERPEPADAPGARFSLDLCSNDYLGYRSSGRLARFALAAAAVHPPGAGASRLVMGEHAAHRSLEQALAGWLETDEAIVFTSGYAANLGTIAALAEEGDLIVSDALNHASIVDGCRLSRASVAVTPHRAVDEVRRALRGSSARRRWVVTEGYFSMEGDVPDLAALRTICDEEDAALIVDEAHAFGVLGPNGRGSSHAAGVRPDVVVGTLGKALGAQGAFVAGSRELCRWLWNRARTFVFSTGLSPLLSAIALAAVEEARRDDSARSQVAAVASRLRHGLAQSGISVASSLGPILPVVLGSEATALTWSRQLGARGVRVQAIRPPTVPTGTSRLRITARADLSEPHVEHALSALAQVCKAARG